VGERAAELFQPGMHGTTFGGTPLACAAALAVLDVIEREQLLAHVARSSPGWIGAIDRFAVDFPGQVRGVRGHGFMIGIQLTGEPGPLVAALRERGLLSAAAGGNVVRLLPPLNATVEELNRSVEIFRAALAAAK
jgi:acetylornithine aminotransferase/acetylornithine/N-succinyldiaminopimelate aminotransferase